jgi:ATP synthase, F0 subunit b
MVAAAPLGFNIIEVLFHMLNFGILLICIRFLLYKPIKKFMEKRSEEYKKTERESEKNKKEASELRERHEKILEEARIEAVRILKEAESAAEAESKSVIEAARKQAAEMAERNEQDIEARKVQAKEDLAYSVSELAVVIAAKILEREIKPEDNDSVISAVIDQWKND